MGPEEQTKAARLAIAEAQPPAESSDLAFGSASGPRTSTGSHVRCGDPVSAAEHQDHYW
jgi:hypothetical protein